MFICVRVHPNDLYNISANASETVERYLMTLRVITYYYLERTHRPGQRGEGVVGGGRCQPPLIITIRFKQGDSMSMFQAVLYNVLVLHGLCILP